MRQAAETFVGDLVPGIIGVFGDRAVPKTANDVTVAAQHSSDGIGRMPLKQSELQVMAVKHLAFHCSKNLFLMSHLNASLNGHRLGVCPRSQRMDVVNVAGVSSVLFSSVAQEA